MLNAAKIENLKNEIIYLLKINKLIDENYIFNYAKNYVKEHKIEITKGEIKSIINNLIIQYKNEKTEELIDDFDYNKNPLQDLITSIENEFLL